MTRHIEQQIILSLALIAAWMFTHYGLWRIL